MNIYMQMNPMIRWPENNHRHILLLLFIPGQVLYVGRVVLSACLFPVNRAIPERLFSNGTGSRNGTDKRIGTGNGTRVLGISLATLLVATRKYRCTRCQELKVQEYVHSILVHESVPILRAIFQEAAA